MSTTWAGSSSAGRIPGYGQHANKMSAREYVEKVIAKSLVDPVLTTQLSNGFVLKQLIPDYFPGDSESRGYATFLEWANLDHAPQARRQPMRAAAPVRVCVVQYELRRVRSFDDFGRQCAYFIDVASDQKADFVLFPELVTAQLLSTVRAPRPGSRPESWRPSRSAISSSSRASRSDTTSTSSAAPTSRWRTRRCYNVSYLFRRDGTLAKQYKMHVTPNERRWWGVAPGPGLEVFDTDRGKIAILI